MPVNAEDCLYYEQEWVEQYYLESEFIVCQIEMISKQVQIRRDVFIRVARFALVFVHD